MEPSGGNRWQLLANGTVSKTAQTSENRCRGLRPVAARIPWEGGMECESLLGGACGLKSSVLQALSAQPADRSRPLSASEIRTR